MTNTPEKKNMTFKNDFKRRIAEVKTTRWIRFGVVALIFIAWTVWLGNGWTLLLLPLLFDIYITGYIPFTWWKRSKNPAVRMIMSWVDAIVYALILVYFVFTFIGQNYQIPSSSLEKTLLTGDYLWVNKMSYGPRVPMTPIHFPLVQNTFPITNSKSYIEWPRWEYHRLAGLGKIQTGDIVVFNFPAGDSIVVKQQNPDYHTLKRMIGDDALRNDPALMQQLSSLDSYEASLIRDEIGKQRMLANPDIFGELMYRPVDRRENYVKRAVGLPGETLSIIDGQIYINDKRQPWPKEAQFNYVFQMSSPMSDADWEEIGVAVEDRHSRAVSLDMMSVSQLENQGFNINSNNPYIYVAPLSDAMLAKLMKMPSFVNAVRETAPKGEYLFPAIISDDWTRADYGPVRIPKKGETIRLTVENWPMYERIIRNYENHSDSYVRNGKIYVDGKQTDSYTFEMDYYFMMGDNRDNSLDSRYWGFVPEDHIVGKPMRVLISFDKDKSLLNGGIRWNRIFKNANSGF